MTFIEELEKRIQKLKAIICEKEKSLSDVPEGSIHIFHSDNRTQYYLNDNGKRKYIRESDRKLVEALCQKDYDKKVLAAAQKELKQLEKINRNYLEKSCEAVYEKLSEERKKLILPICLSDEEFVRKWEQTPYEKKRFYDEYPEFYTDKGERVRSKTEIIIANALFKHGIPYHYEAPIKLDYYGVVHPDFTVLNTRLRKEIYWEHLGMMDDPTYAEKALQKIAAYEQNRIFPGEKLILTYETRKTPINQKLVTHLIQHYLQ